MSSRPKSSSAKNIIIIVILNLNHKRCADKKPSAAREKITTSVLPLFTRRILIVNISIRNHWRCKYLPLTQCQLLQGPILHDQLDHQTKNKKYPYFELCGGREGWGGAHSSKRDLEVQNSCRRFFANRFFAPASSRTASSRATSSPVTELENATYETRSEFRVNTKRICGVIYGGNRNRRRGQLYTGKN